MKVHYAQIDYGIDKNGNACGALCPCGIGGRSNNYSYSTKASEVTCERCNKWLYKNVVRK